MQKTQEHVVGYSIVVMAAIVVVLAGVKFITPILVPFLLSLFIAIILSPAYSFLVRKKIPEIIAIVLVMLSFLILLAMMAKLIGSSVHEFSQNIDIYAQKLTVYYNTISNVAKDFGLEIPANEIATLLNTKQLMHFVSSLIEGLGALFTNGFVVILTVVFMLLESQHFVKKIEYADGHKKTMQHINEIFTQIKSYMVIKALISLLTGCIIWLGLSFIGTDYAFLWGVLAFLLNFIPNIGSIIAAVPAVLITLVQFGALHALLVSLLYFFVNIVIGSILEPRIMGKGLGLSTLVVFLSLIFWGWLLGMVGMLLSIPLTIMAKIIFAANKNTQWLAVLLGSAESLEK
jgi:predicted PurR-regulated permease PerM